MIVPLFPSHNSNTRAVNLQTRDDMFMLIKQLQPVALHPVPRCAVMLLAVVNKFIGNASH